MDVITPLVIGFFGSMHCVGMCGPIALSLPFGNKLNSSFWLKSLQYNLGRVFTYSMLGAIFGGLGFGLKIAGLQQLITIGIGVIMILSLFFTTSYFSFTKAKTSLNKTAFFVKSKLAELLKSNKKSTLFFLGVLNGLLPCGLVYLGIGGAITTGSFDKGAIFMAAFGLGTFPAMLMMFALKPFLNSSKLLMIRKTIPFFVFLLGCLFVLRGLNLDVPYLSPMIDKPIDEIQNCDTIGTSGFN